MHLDIFLLWHGRDFETAEKLGTFSHMLPKKEFDIMAVAEKALKVGEKKSSVSKL